MKANITIIITACGVSWLLNLAGLRAQAMDRLAALSMIESGNDDRAIGRAGKVSRFQIKPSLWRQYAGAAPLTARTNLDAALRVTQEIMADRCRNFERHFHRPPTDFEYYVLWNAPGEIRNPGKMVTEKARRFCNLVAG